MSNRQAAFIAFMLSALLFLPAPLFAHVCVESADCCCCDGCAESDLALSCAAADCCFEIPMQSEQATPRTAPTLFLAVIHCPIVHALNPANPSERTCDPRPPDSTARRLAALCMFLK